EHIPAMFDSREDYLMFTQAVLGLEYLKIETENNHEELLDKLIKKMLGSCEIKPEDIDLIILTEEKRLDTKKNLGKYIQHRYSMANAFVLNISGNHCANMAYAWTMVNKCFSHTDHIKNILILNASITDAICDRVIGTYGVLSDGAGLMLLKKERGICSLLDTVALSKGALNKVDMNQDNSITHLKYTNRSIMELLTRNAVQINQVKKIITQNANPMLLTNALAAESFDLDRIFIDNIGRLGHIDSVDFIVNLKDVIDSGTLNKNDLLVAFNMGWAGSYVSSLISLN
ncbi:hypothetical protein, partial [Fulvivirga kasyanovii]